MSTGNRTTSAAGLVLAAALIAGPAPGQSPQSQSAAGGRDQSQLVYEIQQLKEDIRELRGMIEQQQVELENLRRRQRDQYLDLDERLSDVRGGSGTSASDAAANAAAATGGSQQAASSSGSSAPAQQDTPEVRAPQSDEREVAAISRPQGGEAADVPAESGDVKAQYDEAFADLKALRYDRSAQKFRSFLGNHPDSEYADNAQYWLGESFYAVGNYGKALEAFDALLSNYPDSPKAQDALLKIGYTHYEMQNWEQARAALERVQEQYPESTVARLAKNRLRTMRLEGHF